MNPWKLTRGQRLLVNLKNGDAIFGTIREINRHLLYLGDAQLVMKNGERMAMDGEAIIPADPEHGQVAWLQVV